jgi:restriction system protein
VARRRGFFAEMQHQSRLADQRQAAAQRQYAAATRRAEQAQRASERAELAAGRASDAERKRLEKEAADAQVAAKLADVEQRNAELTDQLGQLDGLLAATLGVDDYLDLESLREIVDHPPFPREDLRLPSAPPFPIPDPPLPVKQEPAPVSGMFGRKQKEAAALAAVEQQYATDYWAWKQASDSLPARWAAQQQEHLEAEQARAIQLAEETSRYEAECASRETEASEHNKALDALINGLAYGTVDAVQEYVGIVLANSVYPEWFPVTHDAEFDPTTAELTVHVGVPGPDHVPAIKGYKYVKASDEIAPIAATQKDVKDRYAATIHNIALRSVHEVFEADRRELIKSMAVEVGTDSTDPATGRPTHISLAALATTREQFNEIDLANVIPGATLTHLGAVVSKNPHGLIGIDPAGVRRI